MPFKQGDFVVRKTEHVGESWWQNRFGDKRGPFQVTEVCDDDIQIMFGDKPVTASVYKFDLYTPLFDSVQRMKAYGL